MRTSRCPTAQGSSVYIYTTLQERPLASTHPSSPSTIGITHIGPVYTAAGSARNAIPLERPLDRKRQAHTCQRACARVFAVVSREHACFRYISAFPDTKTEAKHLARLYLVSITDALDTGYAYVQCCIHFRFNCVRYVLCVHVRYAVLADIAESLKGPWLHTRLVGIKKGMRLCRCLEGISI